MGHLLESLKRDYSVIVIDERSGSYLNQGSLTNVVTKESTPVLINGGAIVSSSAYYKTAALAMGTQDFTVLSKGAICDDHLITGILRPLIINGSNLRMIIDAVGYDSTSAAVLARDSSIAVSADRSGSAMFFHNGLKLGNNLDISAKVATDIPSAQFTHEGSGVLSNAQYLVFIIGKALDETEIQVLTSELEQVPDQRVSCSVTAPDGTPELYFKGELGVLANETATTSGFLENTGCKVLSGSAKMITEKVNGAFTKSMEGISNGLLYMPMLNDKLDGLYRYEDTGAGYTLVTTDLATAKTYPIVAGKKTIWASRNHNLDIHQRV